MMGFNFGAKGERVRAMRDAAAKLAPARSATRAGQSPPIAGRPRLRIYVLGPPRDAELLGVTERASEMYGPAGVRCRRADRAGAGRRALPSTAVIDDAPFDPNVGSDLAAIGDSAGLPVRAESGDTAAFVRDHYIGPTGAGAAASSRNDA